MNARLFLLVLVTALFMAAWDGDQAAIARRNVEQTTQLASNTDNTTDASQVHRLASISDDSVDAQEAKTAAPADVPLPQGIAPGHYQAVNATGQTVRLEVTSSASTGSAKRDFYTVDAKDGIRWYLVRIES